MKRFERTYLYLQPFLPPLYRQVRTELLAAARRSPTPIDVLDVGGRKSHYTVGIPGSVTISDLPRERELQHELNLGLTDEMIAQIHKRRSNVRQVVFDDMTRSNLPAASFDLVVAVEVLEHVDEDSAFVREVARVLRPHGCFIMSTPNGDAVPLPHNSDHKRHYTAAALRHLLGARFEMVEVRYAIVNSVFRRAGLRPWSVRQPLRTACSMLGNLVSGVESSPRFASGNARSTRHLIACCRRQA
jgi:SAM-dependent methyltransferase